MKVKKPALGRPGTLASATPPTEPFDPNLLPPLKFEFHWFRPTLYILFLLFCNIVVPCILYYPLIDRDDWNRFSSTWGLVMLDAPFRLYKLVRYHKHYGPLNDAKWWHLDFFSWVYTIALFVFAFPLAIAPAVPVYNFFLVATALLVAPVGLIFLLSLKSWRLPFWLSSDPPRTPSKPATYYILEDIVAVDFSHGRYWRKAVEKRYAVSQGFRALMWNLTLYWAVISAVYFGITCAVTWSASLNVAFGLTLGLFFVWALVAGLGNYALARWGL